MVTERSWFCGLLRADSDRSPLAAKHPGSCDMFIKESGFISINWYRLESF